VKLFRLLVIVPVQQRDEVPFEYLYFIPVWFNLEEGFVEGEAGTEGGKDHDGVKGFGLKGGGKYGKKFKFIRTSIHKLCL